MIKKKTEKSKFSSGAHKISVGFCSFLFEKPELDVICLLSKGNSWVVRCKRTKGRIFFALYYFVVFNEITRAVSSMKASELTE